MSKKDLSVLKLNHLILNKKISPIYSNFKNQLEKNIKKNIFLVAVSGGPDSLALSALTQKYLNEKNQKAYFVLVDHSIRSNSAKEAKAVKNLFKQKKMNLVVLKNTKKIDKNIQSNARDIRYKLLADFCIKKGVKFITTAHHKDDQIETFLIRLSRGSGIQGLSAMNKITRLNSKVKLFRPLLNESKKELTYIAKSFFGKVFKDPSNQNKKYLRTKIRSLIGYLEKSGIKSDRIISSINNLAAARDTLNNYIQKIEKSCLIKKKNNIEINLEKFFEEKDDIQLKIISNSLKFISKNYYPPRAKKVLNLISRIKSENKLKSTLGGCLILRNEKNLFITKEL